jgi:hypothetical protein
MVWIIPYITPYLARKSKQEESFTQTIMTADVDLDQKRDQVFINYKMVNGQKVFNGASYKISSEAGDDFSKQAKNYPLQVKKDQDGNLYFEADAAMSVDTGPNRVAYDLLLDRFYIQGLKRYGADLWAMTKTKVCGNTEPNYMIELNKKGYAYNILKDGQRHKITVLGDGKEKTIDGKADVTLPDGKKELDIFVVSIYPHA